MRFMIEDPRIFYKGISQKNLKVDRGWRDYHATQKIEKDLNFKKKLLESLSNKDVPMIGNVF